MLIRNAHIQAKAQRPGSSFKPAGDTVFAAVIELAKGNGKRTGDRSMSNRVLAKLSELAESKRYASDTKGGGEGWKSRKKVQVGN